jgi:energy-converting hydrogenase Eha subunit A
MVGTELPAKEVPMSVTVNVYLAGWVSVTIAFLLMSRVLAHPSASRNLAARGSVSFVAGMVWPLVLLGVLEFIVVRLLAQTMSGGHSSRATLNPDPAAGPTLIMS